MASSKKMLVLVLASFSAITACSSAEDFESSSAAATVCPWDPGFGTYGCYQGDWWIEFSVTDTTTKTMKVEIAGNPVRTIDLSNVVSLWGGQIKFTGGPSDGPVPSGSLMRITTTRTVNNTLQSATSNWFAYQTGTAVVECSDGGTADAAADAPKDSIADVKDSTADVKDSTADAKDSAVDAPKDVATDVSVSDGGCASQWSPLWQEQPQYAGAWWAEFAVVGGGSLAKTVSLEVVGGATYNLSYGYGKWTGGLNYVPSGTWVVLHATDATGASAKTSKFQYLVTQAPTTDACGGTPSKSQSCVPLSRGMLTITMDDSYTSQDLLAAPLLAKYGVEATIYNITRQLSTYGALPYAKDIASLGTEIGSHTVTHPDLTTLSAQQLDDELRLSQQYLLANVGSPVDSFASPMGSYNSTVLSAIKKYYTSHRTVNVGMNSMGSSVYELSGDGVYGSTSATAACAMIQQAATYRGWEIFIFHDFTSAATSQYDLLYPIADFESILKCATSTPGLDVVTTKQGADAIRCASP